MGYRKGVPCQGAVTPGVGGRGSEVQGGSRRGYLVVGGAFLCLLVPFWVAWKHMKEEEKGGFSFIYQVNRWVPPQAPRAQAVGNTPQTPPCC